MPKRFDFADFISSLMEKDYPEMIQTAETEAYRVEGISYGVKSCVENRNAGSVQYVDRLKKFLFFMRNGMLPFGADPLVLGQLRMVSERLVEKQQFQPSVLDLFKK